MFYVRNIGGGRIKTPFIKTRKEAAYEEAHNDGSERSRSRSLLRP